MKILLKLIVVLLVSFIFACKSGEDCKNGDPVAMFDSDNPNLLSHQYEAKSQSSVETIKYKMGTELEIWQSGCENLKQEFQFKIYRTPHIETNPFDLAVLQLLQMSKTQESLQSFAEWARVIEMNKDVFEVGVLNEFENAVGIKVDMVEGPDFTTLLLELSQINT